MQKLLAASAVALAMTLAPIGGAAPAQAAVQLSSGATIELAAHHHHRHHQRHRVKVCHWEWHHHHPVKVCYKIWKWW